MVQCFKLMLRIFGFYCWTVLFIARMSFVGAGEVEDIIIGRLVVVS